MAADERSDTGVWIDTATNAVVYAQPVEGTQLVPAGGVLTPDVVKVIDAAKANAPAVTDDAPVAAEPAPVVDPEPEPVAADPAPEKARGTVKKAPARKG